MRKQKRKWVIMVPLGWLRQTNPARYGSAGIEAATNKNYLVAYGTANAVSYGPNLNAPIAEDVPILQALARYCAQIFACDLDTCILLVRHVRGNLFVNFVPSCKRLSFDQGEYRRTELVKGVCAPRSLGDKGGPTQQLPFFQPPGKSGVRWKLGAELLPTPGRNPVRPRATNLV